MLCEVVKKQHGEGRRVGVWARTMTYDFLPYDMRIPLYLRYERWVTRTLESSDETRAGIIAGLLLLGLVGARALAPIDKASTR